MIPMLIGKIPRKKSEARARELLDMVGLSHRTDFKPNQLSGGEEQRVAIARSLAMEPKIVFADELTAKLDARNSEKVLKILKDINQQGVCIIAITHDPKVAGYFKKRLVLEHGKVIDSNF